MKTHFSIAELLNLNVSALPSSTGACLMLHISEYPRHAAEYSWSLDWANSRHSALWLTPGQWDTYLARLARLKKNPTILCLQASPFRVSTAAARTLSQSPTVGIRWLSGSERLQIMGFSSDWMRPTLRKLGLRETPSARKSPAGLPKNSSQPSDK